MADIIDDNQWYSQEVQTQSDPILDPGTGKPYIIRFFQFKKNPEMWGKIKRYGGNPPSNQDLFNMHWRQIRSMLWGDGLVPAEEVEPRFHMGKKGYKIVILCRPRLGAMVAEKMNNITDLLKKSP